MVGPEMTKRIICHAKKAHTCKKTSFGFFTQLGGAFLVKK